MPSLAFLLHRCHGGIAVMCVKSAEVAVDSCTIGGSSDGARRASDGIVAMCKCECVCVLGGGWAEREI